MIAALMQTFLTVNLPNISSDINAELWYGWITGSYIASSTLFIPLAVGLLERLGPRRVYTGAMVIWLVGTTWVASASGSLEILMARVLQGAGTAGLVPAGMEAASAIVGNRFGRFVSAMAVAQSISIAVGAPVGGLLAGPVGWRGSLWVISGLMLLNLMIGARTIPRVGGPADAKMPWQEIWRASAAKRALVHSFLFAGVYFGLITFGPLLLKAEYHFDTFQISVVILPMLLGTAFGAMLAHRLGFTAGSLTTAWLAATIGCAIVLVPVPSLVALGGAITSIGVGIGFTTILMILKNDLGCSASAASGALQATRNIGGAIFAVLLTVPIQLGASSEDAAGYACVALAILAASIATISVINIPRISPISLPAELKGIRQDDDPEERDG